MRAHDLMLCRTLLLAVVLILFTPSIAFAWPGFEWKRWLEITGVSRPDVTSPQAGHHELLPLLQTDFETANTIGDVREWEEKRTGITSVLKAFLGDPGPVKRAKPGAAERGRQDLGKYERILLDIAADSETSIPAYLLRPKRFGDAKVPVMIVLHQTQVFGKQEPCGMTGDPSMAFAKELAERGMMCVVPDVIGFGEHIPEGGQPYDDAYDFYRRHPNWSCFGKMNWDVSRVIDYLETLPEVDPDRIGVIGHSHGAYGSIMAAVFEPRIRLVVASCGFTTLRADPSPNRWSHMTALMPRLGFYVDQIDRTPFDWHEIIACIAPRPYFNWATLADDVFPNTDNLSEVYKQVRQVYGLYGEADQFVGKLAPGAHRFPEEIREEAYQWIERQFAVELRPGA